MKTMIKAAFVVASLTGAAMADTPKKPDVTKPADKDAKAGSGSADTKMGSGSAAKTPDKTPAKTPAKDAPKTK